MSDLPRQLRRGSFGRHSGSRLLAALVGNEDVVIFVVEGNKDIVVEWRLVVRWWASGMGEDKVERKRRKD